MAKAKNIDANGNRTFKTYPAWRRFIRLNFVGATFEGNLTEHGHCTAFLPVTEENLSNKTRTVIGQFESLLTDGGIVYAQAATLPRTMFEASLDLIDWQAVPELGTVDGERTNERLDAKLYRNALALIVPQGVPDAWKKRTRTVVCGHHFAELGNGNYNVNRIANSVLECEYCKAENTLKALAAKR